MMERRDCMVGLIIGLTFWAVVIWALTLGRDTIRKQPGGKEEKKLLNEILSKIQELAPDFDGASVVFDHVDSSTKSFGVSFRSLSGKRFEYNFEEHGYIISKDTAYMLANQIADKFGGECRNITSYYSDKTAGYKVIGPRELAAEAEEKRKRDSLTRL